MIKNKKGPGRPVVMKTIKDFLSAPTTRKLFDEGKEQVGEGGGYAEFDDGKYRCQIVSATMGQSKTQQRWQHVFGFKFLEGEYKGQTKYAYQGLENSMGYTMMVQTFSKLGIEIEVPEDLEAANKKVVKEKPVVDIRLQTKNEFQNVLVLKAVEAEDAEEDNNNDTDDDEDDEDEDTEEKETEESEEENEDDEEKPKKKSSKKDDDEEEDEDEEDKDDEEDTEESEPEEDKVKIEVGTKVKINYEDDEVIGKVVRLDETKGAERIKVKLKDGEKVWVKVPDEVVDVIA